MARIYGKKIDLENSSLRDFFEQRGRSINNEHPLTSVMYQDGNPQLAEMRDVFEKERVQPLLNLGPDTCVLDIGCGIGRWADALSGRVARYHGLDFSESLIAAAVNRHNSPEFSFQVMAAQDLEPSKLIPVQLFNLILISGVLIYLNDSDILNTLEAAAACCDKSALIYIREPVALNERLTLSNFSSAELNSNYNAIYRTEAELTEAFSVTLLASGFKLTTSEYLYPDQLNNRRETSQRIFIFCRP